MNYFLLLAVIAGVAVAQDPTGNPLIDVQIGAEAIHQMYEGTFDNIRFYSSDILNEQNNELLEVALDAISSWGPAAEVIADTPSTGGCTGCQCTGTCGAAVPAGPQIVAEPIEVRLRKLMTTFSTPAIGEATRTCINTAQTTLRDRQEAILEYIELGRYKSTELQLKSIGGLDNFNLLLNFDTYYDTMTAVIYESYFYLTNVSTRFIEW